MASDLSKALLQLRHLLIRLASPSSTQLLQKTCPHPLRIVFLKLLRQTEQITKFCNNSQQESDRKRVDQLTLSAYSSSDELLWHLTFHLLQSLLISLTSTLAFSSSVSVLSSCSFIEATAA